ncbi:MAG: MFS transporter [Firmicutes bacterium]|nr:MFS transporter [Alicyclobacillaceae bacterium]MCL6496862.1 MFS transporter [Bacillota bacterium]
MPGRWMWAYPNFVRLWAGQTLSLAGDAFTEVALTVWALRLGHGSGLAVGTMLLAASVPRIGLGWLVPLVIDRWDKRRLMWWADAARAAVVAAIPFLPGLGAMWAAVFGVQALGMFYLPAVRAVAPETVPTTQIPAATAALAASQAAAQIAGFVLAGAVVWRWGPTVAFWADAASYLVCGASVWTLTLDRRVWQPRPGPTGDGFVQELREGLAYHLREPRVLHLLAVSAWAGLALNGLTVLGAVAVLRLWHETPGFYGLLMAAMAGGFLFGSTGFSRWHPKGRYGWWIAGGLGLGGGLSVALAWTPSPWAAAALFGGMGWSNAAFLLPMRSWIGQVVPLEYRGRVYATRSVVLAAAGALSAVAGGWLAQVAGVRLGLEVLGATLVGAGWYAWRVPAIRAIAVPAWTGGPSRPATGND